VLKVDRLMREVEDDVRRARRKRLLARGGASEYRDEEVYERVDRVLRRALEARDHEALLLRDLLDTEHDWQLTLPLRFNSHRPVIGPAIVFFKRRVLLPLTHWLYEYSLENFRRQRRLNMVLFACVEELAIENATLRAARGSREPGLGKPADGAAATAGEPGEHAPTGAASGAGQA
jgi:hypothetical protein